MSISILVSGLPGKMAQLVAEGAISSDLSLIPYALGAASDHSKSVKIYDQRVQIVGPQERPALAERLKTSVASTIAVDYSVPSAIPDNVDFFCRNKLPFVLGTSGGNYPEITAQVKEVGINAVVAANMAPPLVVLRAMFEYAAQHFPGSLSGFDLKIIESHQSTKKDQSATALAMLPLFQKLGVSCEVKDFESVRDQKKQIEMGIPATALGGHAWHEYKLNNPELGMDIGLTHNVNGRAVYIDGTIRACRFLDQQRSLGVSGRVFSMIDVLRSTTTQ